MSSCGQLEGLKDELTRYFRFPRFYPPIPANGKYFFTEKQADQERPVVYVKDSLAGEARELINLNINDTEKELDYWYPSIDGSYLAYGLSESGDEISTLHIMDTATGQNLEDIISNASSPSLCWLSDSSGFYYVGGPKPGSVEKTDARMYSKVFFHKLGDSPDNDELVFGEGRPKDDMIGLELSSDSSKLAIGAIQNWNSNKQFIFNTRTKKVRSAYWRSRHRVVYICLCG